MSTITSARLAHALMACAPSDPLRDSRPVARLLAGLTGRDIDESAVHDALEAANRVDDAERDLCIGDVDEQIMARKQVRSTWLRLEAQCERVLEARVL